MLDNLPNITVRFVDDLVRELDETGRVSLNKKRSVPEDVRQDYLLMLEVMAARGVIRYKMADGGWYVISKFDEDSLKLFCDQFKPDHSASGVFSDITKLKQQFLYVLSVPVVDDADFDNGMYFFSHSKKITPATVDPSKSEDIPRGLTPARLDYFGGLVVIMAGQRYELRGKIGTTDDIIDKIFENIKKYPNRKYSRTMLARTLNLKNIASQSLKTIFRNNVLSQELPCFTEIGSKYICIHPEAYLTKDQADAIIARATKI